MASGLPAVNATASVPKGQAGSRPDPARQPPAGAGAAGVPHADVWGTVVALAVRSGEQDVWELVRQWYKQEVSGPWVQEKRKVQAMTSLC